jgi:hypothetical protein
MLQEALQEVFIYSFRVPGINKHLPRPDPYAKRLARSRKKGAISAGDSNARLILGRIANTSPPDA